MHWWTTNYPSWTLSSKTPIEPSTIDFWVRALKKKQNQGNHQVGKLRSCTLKNNFELLVVKNIYSSLSPSDSLFHTASMLEMSHFWHLNIWWLCYVGPFENPVLSIFLTIFRSASTFRITNSVSRTACKHPRMSDFSWRQGGNQIKYIILTEPPNAKLKPPQHLYEKNLQRFVVLKAQIRWSYQKKGDNVLPVKRSLPTFLPADPDNAASPSKPPGKIVKVLLFW